MQLLNCSGCSRICIFAQSSIARGKKRCIPTAPGILPEELRDTTRDWKFGVEDARRADLSSWKSRKWPKWFTPNCAWNPSLVFSPSGDAITPAFRCRVSISGVSRKSCEACLNSILYCPDVWHFRFLILTATLKTGLAVVDYFKKMGDSRSPSWTKPPVYTSWFILSLGFQDDGSHPLPARWKSYRHWVSVCWAACFSWEIPLPQS